MPLPSAPRGSGVLKRTLSVLAPALVSLALLAAALWLASPVAAQWPMDCVALNDIVETHLGNHGNVGIYQRVFGDQAEESCQSDHRDDVRGVFGWAFDQAEQFTGPDPMDLAWPTDCVALNDIVENHLGNHGNVGIYQHTFGDQAEGACRNDHREDVRGVFAWAFDAATASASGPTLAVNELVKQSQAAVRYIRTPDDVCGSAFVVTADGYVVTNSHVLDGARQAVVGTHDGEETHATVVADDPDRDLALLKLPGSGPHPFLAFGRSADLQVGEDLVILGYPLCLETLTATRGILSARYPDWLQTDATANPGNSGGPGLNPQGGVIGVATAKLGGGAVEGVESANFLIDGDLARQVVDEWITRHRAGTPAPKPVTNGVGSGGWASVSAGWNHTCGLRTDGKIACWGDNRYGQATPPPGILTTVSAGYIHSCGVRTDDTILCWGDNSYGQASPPPGAFRTVSAGEHHSCGVRANGTVTCWGSFANYSGDGAKPIPMPSGTFRSVHAGENHTCGLRTDGTVSCWGWEIWNRTTPPSGVFTSIDTGRHSCGVRTNGTVACWGLRIFGPMIAEYAPPLGIFSTVTAGYAQSCGVRSDGTAVCWQAYYGSASTPPPSTFQSISASPAFSFDQSNVCGVQTNGKIACWGDNYYGEGTTPD